MIFSTLVPERIIFSLFELILNCSYLFWFNGRFVIGNDSPVNIASSQMQSPLFEKYYNNFFNIIKPSNKMQSQGIIYEFFIKTISPGYKSIDDCFIIIPSLITSTSISVIEGFFRGLKKNELLI